MTTPGAGARIGERHAPASVRMRAPAVAWEAYQATWAFEPGLADADVATLHELRITTKWLRYTLESIREPMEPAATELIRRVVALQDHLGDIHDYHAAADRARATAAVMTSLRPGQRAAVDRFAAAKDVRVERLQRAPRTDLARRRRRRLSPAAGPLARPTLARGSARRGDQRCDHVAEPDHLGDALLVGLPVSDVAGSSNCAGPRRAAPSRAPTPQDASRTSSSTSFVRLRPQS